MPSEPHRNAGHCIACCDWFCCGYAAGGQWPLQTDQRVQQGTHMIDRLAVLLAVLLMCCCATGLCGSSNPPKLSLQCTPLHRSAAALQQRHVCPGRHACAHIATQGALSCDTAAVQEQDAEAPDSRVWMVVQQHIRSPWLLDGCKVQCLLHERSLSTASELSHVIQCHAAGTSHLFCAFCPCESPACLHIQGDFSSWHTLQCTTHPSICAGGLLSQCSQGMVAIRCAAGGSC